MNFLSPQWTLLFGILISFFIQNSKMQLFAKQWSGKLLQISVIFLGAALNFKAILIQGQTGLLLSFLSISFVFALGALGIKLLNVEKIQGTLISIGTAICGGSAIGALAPIIKADNIHITVSLGVVFLLNAVSVLIFPIVGYSLELTQYQFGIWAALAIHDTSSVVAATTMYGSEALEIGTLIKLIRALWIIPIAFGYSYFMKSKNQTQLKIPWFILGFVFVSLVFTFVDIPQDIKTSLTQISKIGFALTLLLIGLSLNLVQMKTVGFRPLIFGFSLWTITSLLTLVLIITLL